MMAALFAQKRSRISAWEEDLYAGSRQAQREIQIPSVHFGFKGQCASALKLTFMKEM